MREQAAALEQVARSRRAGPQVAILAACDLTRAGLSAGVEAAGGAVVAEINSPALLGRALMMARADVLVAEAGSLNEACPIARSHAVPILAVAPNIGAARVALRAAQGVVVVPVAGPTLVEALVAVARGQSYCDDALLVDPFNADGLSVTERAIVSLVVEGRQPVEIGPVLSLSHNTVRHYLSRIYARLEVRDLGGLRRWAEQRQQRGSRAPSAPA